MQRDDIFRTVLSEFIRIEADDRLASLNKNYTDGGRNSGDRKRQLADAAVEAYANASHAMKQIDDWSANN